MEEETLENLENNSNTWGGARPGAGRKPGGQNASTKRKLQTLRAVRNRIRRNAQLLLDSQMSLARGLSFLYHTTVDEKGKRTTEKIDDPEVIRMYLDGEFDDLQDEFYFITTRAPQGRAIDSMLDRAFGKAQETIKLDNDKPLTSVTVKIIKSKDELKQLGDGRDDSPRSDSGDGENEEDNMPRGGE